MRYSAPGMRTGVDIAIRCDRDVTLAAAAAGHLGLGVRKESQLGPLASQRRVNVQPHGGAVCQECADACGRGLKRVR